MIANFKNIPMIVKFYHSEPTRAKYQEDGPEYRVCTCNIRIGKEAPATFKAKIHNLHRVMPKGKEDLLAIGGYVSYPSRETYDKSVARRTSLDDALVDFMDIMEKANVDYDIDDIENFIEELSKSVSLA